MGDVGEFHRVVRWLKDGLGEVAIDLPGVDVEGRRELDVAHMVRREPWMHEPGDESVVRSVAVIVHTLHERRCAIADTDNRDANGCHGALLGLYVDSPRALAPVGVCKCAQCNTIALAARERAGGHGATLAQPATSARRSTLAGGRGTRDVGG